MEQNKKDLLCKVGLFLFGIFATAMFGAIYAMINVIFLSVQKQELVLLQNALKTIKSV